MLRPQEKAVTSGQHVPVNATVLTPLNTWPRPHVSVQTRKDTQTADASGLGSEQRISANGTQSPVVCGILGEIKFGTDVSNMRFPESVLF